MTTTFNWKIYRVGNTERWYDRHTRSWVIRTVDAEGNQIGNCHEVFTAREAKDIQKSLVNTSAAEQKYWCSDCRHYCTTACCDHWNKAGERIR